MWRITKLVIQGADENTTAEATGSSNNIGFAYEISERFLFDIEPILALRSSGRALVRSLDSRVDGHGFRLYNKYVLTVGIQDNIRGQIHQVAHYTIVIRWTYPLEEMSFLMWGPRANEPIVDQWTLSSGTVSNSKSCYLTDHVSMKICPAAMHCNVRHTAESFSPDNGGSADWI